MKIGHVLLRVDAGAGGAAGQRVDVGDLELGCGRQSDRKGGESQPRQATRMLVHDSSLDIVARFSAHGAGPDGSTSDATGPRGG